MHTVLAIAAGGAVGAVLRHFVAGMVSFGTFPLGVLVVNVLGSALLGGLIAASAHVFHLSYDMRAFLVVGCLGAFTTFSTFAMDSVLLMERGEVKLSFLYMFASVFLAVGAFWLAMWVVRQLTISA